MIFKISDDSSNDCFILNQSNQSEICSSTSSTIVTNKKKKTNYCESGIFDGRIFLLIYMLYKLINNNFRRRSFLEIKKNNNKRIQQ